jgi:hypothetical protein
VKTEELQPYSPSQKECNKEAIATYFAEREEEATGNLPRLIGSTHQICPGLV